MYDPALPEEGVQGWELAQFLPEDEELFSFDTPEATPSKHPSIHPSENPVEAVLAKHYRTILARNRQKILVAQKQLVRARVALHQAYQHKIHQLTAPLEPLREGEFLVTSTTNGPSVHTLSGERQPISWGHIMTSHEWGIEYVLDPATFSYDDRHTYLNRLYKHRVALLDTEHELLELLVDAYKDESPEMAEAVKSYRDRYRAKFSIETGQPVDTSATSQAHAEKIVRAFLTGLQYDFPELGLEVRCAHPIEDVGFGIQLVVHRAAHGVHHTMLISITDLPTHLQALNPFVVVEPAHIDAHLDPRTLHTGSWREKLEKFSHHQQPSWKVYISAKNTAQAFAAWHNEPDQLSSALYTPDKQLPRDFGATLITKIFSEALSPQERQLIISSL